MPDIFVERSSSGFLGNLGKSIKGVVAGIAMFVASFPILWMNEGCINLGKVARTSTAAAPDRADAANDGKLVSVTQKLETREQLSDPKYVKPGNWVSLFRQAEMYAWVEKKESKTEKKIGGGSETVTQYEYVKQWTSDPESSTSFKVPEGHANPEPRERSDHWVVKEATVGAYSFSPGDTTGGFWGFGLGLPAPDRLNLTPEILSVAPATGADPNAPRLVDGYLFLGVGTVSNPQIGDTRISFTALSPGGLVTLFGRQQGGRIEAFVVEADTRFFRAVEGDRETAIRTLLTEHSIQTWIVRALGFILMWGGLCAVFGPLSAVLDVLPFLGNASRTLVSIAMFPIALVLSGITIVVSIIAHNVIALVVVMAVAVGAGVFLLKGRKPRTA